MGMKVKNKIIKKGDHFDHPSSKSSSISASIFASNSIFSCFFRYKISFISSISKVGTI